MKTLLLLLLFFTITLCQAQTAQFAIYKNNAQSAYTIIHDDFGGEWANGIELYADSICYKNNIPFCFATITKECGKTDWLTAQRMIRHGHEIMNHSMSHKCGVKSDWCNNGDWNEKDFPIEIDSSTSFIQRKAKTRPRFFAFPYDQSSDTMINYLSARQYWGARAGSPNKTNEVSNMNWMHFNYTMHKPDMPLQQAYDYINKALVSQTWGIQVFHGVNDQSWGAVPFKEYETYITFLAEQQQQKKIWVCTLSEMYLYQKTIQEVEVALSSLNGKPQHLHFKNSRVEHVAVSIVISLNNAKINSVKQNGKILSYSIENDKLVVLVNPFEGDVVLE
jgi:peptidoglycan/xylan/chitin deacetylase (PgdA/CDA1 family)